MTGGANDRYELRTFLARADRLEDLVEQWESVFHPLFARQHRVLGVFLAHPERSELPVGVAVLLRHGTDACGQADGPEGARFGQWLDDVSRSRLDELVERTTHQLLEPLAFSRLT